MNFTKLLDLPDLESRTIETAISLNSLTQKFSHSSTMATQVKLEEPKKKKQSEKEEERKTIARIQDAKSSKDNNDLDEDQDSKKNKCGLRALSNKVRLLVNESGKMTYKQVAQIIVEQQIIEMKQENQNCETSRETKNIKRRVYDALSVLINSQILIKNDRYVLPTPQSFKTGKKFSKVYCVLRDLENEVSSRRKSCQNKMLILQHLFQRYAMVKSLVARNKAMPINTQKIKEREKEISRYLLSIKECAEDQEETQKSLKDEHSIAWPLVALRVPKGAEKVGIFIEKDSKMVAISMKESLKMEADLDLISQMKHLPPRVMSQFENEVNDFINGTEIKEVVEKADKKCKILKKQPKN